MARGRGERSSPFEELNSGAVTEARPAASAIVMRDARDGPEVLLVKRNPEARFVGGAWVFPGGAVHPSDSTLEAAARRELAEEADVRLESEDALVAFSHWVTPPEARVRFDAWFFLAEAPAGTDGAPDGVETVDLRWLRPAEALEGNRRGEMPLVFPTIKDLEELADLESVADGLVQARARDVEPVLPRIVGTGGEMRVVLPGEAEYPG